MYTLVRYPTAIRTSYTFVKYLHRFPKVDNKSVEITNAGNYKGIIENPKRATPAYILASLVIFPTREKARGTANYFPVVRPVTPPGYITGDPSKFPADETSVLYNRTDGVSHV